jgi:hypothetical protein
MKKALKEYIDSIPYYGSCTTEYKEGIEDGARWQAKRMYNKKDMIKLIQFIVSQESLGDTGSVSETTAKYYLKLFENKHYVTTRKSR